MTGVSYPAGICSHPGTLPSDCTNQPVMQYRKALDNNGNVTAFFACATHEYTDPLQSAGLHQATCTLFPCNCTPVQPVNGPVGNLK